MFKQINGFDPDNFELVSAILIIDNYKERRSLLSLWEEGDSYLHNNLSGTYLIQNITPIEITITSVRRETFKLPVKYFDGEQPRMSIRFLQ